MSSLNRILARLYMAKAVKNNIISNVEGMKSDVYRDMNNHKNTSSKYAKRYLVPKRNTGRHI